MEKPRYFILEYMEETLSDWSLAEIKQMHKYLSLRPGNVLIITKVCDMLAAEDEENTQNMKALADFIEANNDDCIQLCTKGLEECLNTHSAVFELLVTYDLKTKAQGQRVIEIAQDRVCLLDLRGKKVLEPAERPDFDAYVFGGILGDHPPKDRTFALRPLFTHARNLEEVQMSTDTAILVTELIVNGQMDIGDIPFITHPEIQNVDDPKSSVVMEGFRYVSDRLDLLTGKIAAKAQEQPLMSEFIKNTLLFVDFDFNLM